MVAGSSIDWLHRIRIHIVFVAMCILLAFSSASSAANTWNEAGFLIDYGDGRTTWMWVPFEDTGDVKVIDLLNRTDLPLVTVGFGGLGEGVCQIDDTGCPAGECRTRMCQTSASSPFWRFLKQNDDDWGWMTSGVSGTSVNNGDIFALSWSSTTPELPHVSMADIAEHAGANRDIADPVPALRTEGESGLSSKSSRGWLPAIVVVGSVTILAPVLIIRARTTRASSQ